MRQLRFIFRHVIFRSPRELRGSSNVVIEARVDGAPAGNPYDSFTARQRAHIDLDAASYAREIDVEGRSAEISVTFTVRFDEPGNTAVLGTITHRINWPYLVRDFHDSTRAFHLDWGIEYVEPPVAPAAAPGVFATREDTGGGTLINTAGPVASRLVLRVHDVIPTPHAELHPVGLHFPAGTPAAFTDGRAYSPAPLTAGPPNMIENPGAITIMPTGTDLDDSNCARFRVTYIRPNTLNFTEDDPRLVWSVVSLADGGDAQFWGRSTGRKVALHGTHAGVVGLEVRFQGRLLANYRVLVALAGVDSMPLYGAQWEPKCRGALVRPRSTPDVMETHLQVANKFLWQLGVRLILDTDVTIGHLPRGVAAAAVTPVAGRAGFFDAVVSASLTRGFNPDSLKIASFNSREYVVNFVYVKSATIGTLTLLGMAQIFDTAGGHVEDSGTPSTSWIRPHGVTPGPESESKRMKIFDPSPFAPTPHRFGLFVTDSHANNFEFTGTIAHEFGHALGLMHRLEWPGLGNCGVQYPWDQNLMHRDNATTLAQDLDMIQARAVRQSPLVQHWLAPPPAPAAPAPAAPPPAPAGAPHGMGPEP